MLPRVLCFAALLVALTAVPAGAQAPSPAGPPPVTAEAALLADVSTGRVLYSKAPHALMAPASLTKVVTALVVRERFSLNEMVTVNDAVNGVTGERLGLQSGQRLTVRNLLYAMLLLSGNDAAQALAAHDPGGVPGFVDAMNAMARKMGARDSRFMNPHGLDAPGHKTSAWDLALFGRALLKDKVLAGIVSTKVWPVQFADGSVKTVQNHNKLLFRRPDAVGIKTGYTRQAGNCLLAAQTTPAGTAITVVLKSTNHYGDTTALWDWYATSPQVPGAQMLNGPVRPALQRTVSASSRSETRRAGPASGWGLAGTALAALSMLLTLGLPRRRGALQRAAEFHPYLEKVLAVPARVAGLDETVELAPAAD